MEDKGLVSQILRGYLNNHVVFVPSDIWEKLVKQFEWSIDENGEIVETEIVEKSDNND